MKLIDLDPRWTVEVAERQGMGITFDCPHCQGNAPEDIARLGVWFVNPIDGGSPASEKTREFTSNGVRGLMPLWTRTGDTFETLTLTPSINAEISGHWHGYITNGETV